MTSIGLRLALLSFVVVLGGCVVANAVVEPGTRLRIAPTENINPDSNGRSSPLVVRVYELAAKNAFQNADFFNLYDDMEQTLGNDLIAMEEIVITPGKVHKHPMRLNWQTRYIGVMAAFRDIEDAQWRVLAEADPRDYDKISVTIDSLTLKRSED